MVFFRPPGLNYITFRTSLCIAALITMCHSCEQYFLTRRQTKPVGEKVQRAENFIIDFCILKTVSASWRKNFSNTKRVKKIKKFLCNIGKPDFPFQILKKKTNDIERKIRYQFEPNIRRFDNFRQNVCLFLKPLNVLKQFPVMSISIIFEELI